MKSDVFKKVLYHYFPDAKSETIDKVVMELINAETDFILDTANKEAEELMEKSVAQVDREINEINKGYTANNVLEG
jgi:hypothetical protein